MTTPEHALAPDGAVRVNDVIVGYVAPNRWSRKRTWVVYRRGESTPMSFPHRNSIFADRQAAAEALVGVVLHG